MNQLPLRPNVCMLVLNTADKLFLGERFNEPGTWQFPQGGVETDQPLEVNVLRELHEELGAPTEKFEIIRKLKATHEYEWRTPPDYAAGKWRGQSQTLWLVRFLGEDCEINFTLYDQEFSAFRWCTVEEVEALAEPRRLVGYRAALLEVREYLQK